jgi:predicted AlkP superfamily pyrophosphatase or phosphodiesterase
MTRRASLFFLLALSALGCQPAPQAPAPKKAIFILLDGIPADVLEQVETPALDEIAGQAGYTRAYVGGEKGTYNETPTISAPGYMSMITAAWAHKHNVWGNYDQAPNYNYWNIFRIVEQADSNYHTAIFSTWLDNRTVLIGEGQPGAGDFRLDYAFDGLELDTLQYPHDKARDYILAIDERVADEAASYIAQNGPDLSWVYLEYPDDIGHLFGDGPEMEDAVQKADRQVQRIWEAVKSRQAMGEDWLIVVTTDHGRDPDTGKNHGGQSERERTTWITTNASALNARFTVGEPAITDIAPSILAHLGISAPSSISAELDGTSFIGSVSLDGFRATLEGGRLQLFWNPRQAEGLARLHLALTNHFPQGGTDEYEMLAEVPVAQAEHLHLLTPEQAAHFADSGFLKVWIEAPLNGGNWWVVAR